jgi:exodeoxyribonuclease V beta subunit
MDREAAMTDALVAFDITGPIPSGRFAIEASAGTGKTYALAGLAARYLLEAGIAIDELLVVTYTRAAAAELRDRVRARLVDVAAALTVVIVDPAAVPDDKLLAHLCASDQALRLARAETALAEFDSATITTIHGFATQVLGTLGSAAPGDPDAVLLDDGGQLVREAATDVLIGEALGGRHDFAMLPTLDRLIEVTGHVTRNPGIRPVPSTDPDDSNEAAALRREMVDAVVGGADTRRRLAGRLSFDDVLTRLRDALVDPGSGVQTQDLLRRRFNVALIDEFQDTDPVQWDIFSAVFGAPGTGTTCVLVGDPKQAIYGFRGANVHTYLAAAHAPGTQLESLATNWRSDAAVLEALDVLLDGATFGDDDIRFHHVEAAPAHQASRMVDAAGAPLPTVSLRLALGADLKRGDRKPNDISSDEAATSIFADLADSVRQLLEGARIPAAGGGGGHDDGAGAGDSPARGAVGAPGAAAGGAIDNDGYRHVRPSDICVLVLGHADSPRVRLALEQAGIPAVITKGDSVLLSAAATQWRWLLEGVAQPSHPERARTAALSWFFGWTADGLAIATDEELGEVQEQLHSWADTLAHRGVAEFLAEVWSEGGVAARVLGTVDGDRAMTDLDHIAELLAAAAPPHVAPSGLLTTLHGLALAPKDGDVDAAARRVESEAEAVQIMTVHAAKGLEFPIVCCPSFWREKPATANGIIYQDPDDMTRSVDVAEGIDWPDKTATTQRKALAQSEAVGQNLRLLYVALTRARHHTMVWWTRARGSHKTGLARVLFARQGTIIDPVEFIKAKVTMPADDEAVDSLQPLVDAAAGLLECRMLSLASPVVDRWQAPAPTAAGPLAVATLDRVPDRDRARWSFSLISHLPGQAPLDPLDDQLGDAGAADEMLDGVSDDVATSVAGAAFDAGADRRTADGPTTDADAEQRPGDEVTLDAGAVAAGATTDAATAGGPTALSPYAGLRGGKEFGTYVHSVLEVIDFTVADLAAEVRATIDETAESGGFTGDRDLLTAALCASIETPLGPLAGGIALRDLDHRDRLDELGFDFTLGEAGRSPDVDDVGRVILAHLPNGDPLRSWAEQLATTGVGVALGGHLTGFVDLIFRTRDVSSDGPDRYVVVDYKTNMLSERGQPHRLADYAPDRLAAAMGHHHYPLQALLYSVALHRYLRWRIRDYDPAVRLGGIAYLFLRGMVGPDTPAIDGVPYGVFSWKPPTELVIDLSDLLHGQVVSS